MHRLPDTDEALVLRTDFADDDAWVRLCVDIQRPYGLFQANVSCVSNRAFEGVTAEAIAAAEGGDGDDLRRTYLFIGDRRALTDPDRPVLVLDLFDEPGRTFRVIPSEIGSVENNLSIANMDFRDFADACGPDGIFRGY